MPHQKTVRKVHLAGAGAKPLLGKRVVVTRAREQAAELNRLLAASGAQVLEFPAIGIAPPDSWESLDRAIEGGYDWLVFTSSNGVASFFERLRAKGKDVNSLAGARVAAVGQATADELRTGGLIPDVVPERFVSSELLPLLANDQTGIRTAVIRAEKGRDDVIVELRRRGGEVDLAVAYKTVRGDYDLDELRKLISQDAIDVVTFTSASAVDHFLGGLTPEERGRLLERAAIVSIGPTTSEAIRRHSREPDIVAANATIPALHDAVVAICTRAPSARLRAR